MIRPDLTINHPHWRGSSVVTLPTFGMVTPVVPGVSDTGRATHQADPHAHGIAVLPTGPAYVRPPDEVTIEDNNSSRNFGHGIYVAGRESRGHTIESNVVTGNRGAGILLDGPVDDGVGGVADSAATGNRGRDNAADGFDGNDGCASNRWSDNRFGTVNQPCVAGDGPGAATGRGAAGEV